VSTFPNLIGGLSEQYVNELTQLYAKNSDVVSPWMNLKLTNIYSSRLAMLAAFAAKRPAEAIAIAIKSGHEWVISEACSRVEITDRTGLAVQFALVNMKSETYIDRAIELGFTR
jgi:hypothetical protein